MSRFYRMLLRPSRVSHVFSPCEIRVSLENILLILLRNPHVDRQDPVDPADPAGSPRLADIRSTAIREAGADHIALVLRKRPVAGDVIAEAELSAQPAAKPAPNEPPRRSIIGRRRSVWRRLRLHTRAEDL